MKIELEEKLNSTVYLTLKLGHRANLESFQRGVVYCRSLDYYKNIENEGMPFHDSDEGLQAVFQASQVDFILKTPQGQEIKINKENGLVKNIRISRNISYPALCLHTLHTHGWNKELNHQTKDDLRNFLLPITDLKKFGGECLIILDGEEFNSRLLNQAKKMGIVTRHGMVRYIDTDLVHGHIEDDFLGFVKPKAFQAEREYRYIFEQRDLPDPFEMNIGDLSDITQIVSYEEFCEGLILKLPEE